jgi:uncharacterized membrane protein YqhA
MRRLLGVSRWMMLLATVVCLVLAVAILGYTTVDVVGVVRDLIAGHADGKALTVHAIEVLDHLLFAAVAYIMALGLYALFIDDQLPVPTWLEIHGLDDLKDKLLRVIVLAMAVLFLGQLVAWDGRVEIAALGGGIAAMIAALRYFGGAGKH